MEQHFPETLNSFDFLGHYSDARDALTSSLGPTVPNDLTNFCNPQWCVYDPDDNGSKGFGYDS